MPNFIGNLISVGQFAQMLNLTFTQDYMYLSQMGPPPVHAKLLGCRMARKNTSQAAAAEPISPHLAQKTQDETKIKGKQRKHPGQT